MFKSDRGKPLICQEKGTKPIITVENYIKWYHIFVIWPDGNVTKASFDIIEQINNHSTKTLICDHLFHPLLIEKYAEITDSLVDEVSLATITGRWMFEYYNKEIKDISYALIFIAMRDYKIKSYKLFVILIKR